MRTARKLKTKPVKKHIAQNNIYEWREDKMDKRIIYLDHAATTATRPEVVEAMMPYFTENYGNPSTVYDLGAKNKTVVTESREIIATTCTPAVHRIIPRTDSLRVRKRTRRGSRKKTNIFQNNIKQYSLLYS